jgi:deoxyadenosine/deoxycytidine kinase
MAPITYVIVAGNIGTGKTTAVQQVSLRLKTATAFYEERDVYLARFYSDPERYAFVNQLAYSLQYLNQAVHISKCNEVVIQDRSIYDTHEVFSTMRFEDGLINNEEFRLLERIYDTCHLITQPTLLVVLDASVDVAYQRFEARAHELEVGLTKELLHKLRDRYLAWYSSFNLCAKVLINTDDKPIQIVRESIIGTLNGYVSPENR